MVRIIEEAAHIFFDSLEKTAVEPARFLRLYSVVANIRLVSSERVLRAAERVGNKLVENYEQPVTDAREFIVKHIGDVDAVDPLREFTEECRRERLKALERL